MTTQGPDQARAPSRQPGQPGSRLQRRRLRAPFGGRLVHYWRGLGPGLVTGASDNDPSGITTYSVAGATTGYRLLWLAVATFPLLVAVQSMAARIGAVKEAGLGKVIQERYGRGVLVGSVVVLLVANVVTISADLAGVAAGVHLLVPLSTRLGDPRRRARTLGSSCSGPTAASRRLSSG